MLRDHIEKIIKGKKPSTNVSITFEETNGIEQINIFTSISFLTLSENCMIVNSKYAEPLEIEYSNIVDVEIRS